MSWPTEQQAAAMLRVTQGHFRSFEKCLSHDVSLMKVGRGSAWCRAALQWTGVRCVAEQWTGVRCVVEQ